MSVVRAPDFIDRNAFYSEVLDAFDDALLAWGNFPGNGPIVDIYLEVEAAVVQTMIALHPTI